jgi:hypothetical protein
MKEIERSKYYLYNKIKENTSYTNANKLDAIELLPTLDEDTAVKITYQNRPYRLNSIYSPTHEAERWAKQFEMKNIGIVVTMFGLGNGVFAREILRKLNQQGALFIYEPCPDLFFYVLEHYDLTDILGAGNVSITVEGVNDIEISNLLNNHVDWMNLRSQIVCAHPQYLNIFTESAKVFHKILQDNNNRVVVNKNTDVAISRLLISNTLKNIRYMVNSNIVTDLVGKFPKDVPAIVVAAGPSLDKNIEELKNAKGKAVIFAVDTAMKYLLAHDILPDFVVTLDPKKSMRHLADPRCSELPLFCRMDSRPEHLQLNRKGIIFYNLEGYVKSVYDALGKDTGYLHSGGSVATGAFSICETLGFQRIILVGQDLAYSGGATHAGGITVDVSDAGSKLEIVEDICGNPIKTRYDWYVYIKWFEDAVALFGGEEVIDATEGGARLKGTTIMTLKDAIGKYCIAAVDCESILSGLSPTLNGQERDLLLLRLKQDLKDLEAIKSLAEEACVICDRLLNKYSKSIEETPGSMENNRKLSELNRTIEGKAVYELIDWDIAEATSDQIGSLYQYSDDERKEKLATYEKAKAIYEAIRESAGRLTPLFSEGLDNLLQDLEKDLRMGRYDDSPRIRVGGKRI